MCISAGFFVFYSTLYERGVGGVPLSTNILISNQIDLRIELDTIPDGFMTRDNRTTVPNFGVTGTYTANVMGDTFIYHGDLNITPGWNVMNSRYDDIHQGHFKFSLVSGDAPECLWYANIP